MFNTKTVTTTYFTVKINQEIENRLASVAEFCKENCVVTKSRLDDNTVQFILKGDAYEVMTSREALETHIRNKLVYTDIAALTAEVKSIHEELQLLHGSDFKVNSPYQLLRLLVITFNRIYVFLNKSDRYNRDTMIWPLEHIDWPNPSMHKTKMQPTPEFADQIFKLIERFVSSPHIAKVKPSGTSEQHKRTYGGEFGEHLYKHKLSTYESNMREVWERVLNHNHKDEVQAARMCKIFLDAKIVDPSEIFIFSGRSTGKPYYHPALDYASCPAVARLLMDAGANPNIYGDDYDFIGRITSNHDTKFLTPEWAALISHPVFVAKVSEHDATFSEHSCYSHPVAQVSRGNNLLQMTELLKSYEVSSDIIKFCIANGEGSQEMKALLKEHAVTRNIQYEGHETQFQRRWRLEREERERESKIAEGLYLYHP